jgi:hypothetical protein
MTAQNKCETLKNAVQQGRHSSHPLRRAVFRRKRFPRVRKKRVPGANVLARLRRAQPGGLLGD